MSAVEIGKALKSDNDCDSEQVDLYERKLVQVLLNYY